MNKKTALECMNLRNGIEEGYILETKADSELAADYEYEYHSYEEFLDDYNGISALYNKLDTKERKIITDNNPYADIINSKGYFINKKDREILEQGRKKNLEFREKTISEKDMSFLAIKLRDSKDCFHIGDIMLLGEMSSSEKIVDQEEYESQKKKLESEIQLLKTRSGIHEVTASLMFEPEDNTIKTSTGALIGGAIGGVGGAMYGALKAQEAKEEHQKYAQKAEQSINSQKSLARSYLEQAEELSLKLETLEPPKINKKKYIVVIGIKTFVGIIPLVLRSENYNDYDWTKNENLTEDFWIDYEDIRISLQEFVQLLKKEQRQKYRNVAAKCFIETGNIIEETTYVDEIIEKNNITDNYDKYIEAERQYLAKDALTKESNQKYVLDEESLSIKQNYAKITQGLYNKVSNGAFCLSDGTVKYDLYIMLKEDHSHIKRNVQPELNKWKNVVSVVQTYKCVYALTETGKVYGTCVASYLSEELKKQYVKSTKRVAAWRNIIEIYGFPFGVVGLDVNGTLHVSLEVDNFDMCVAAKRLNGVKNVKKLLVQNREFVVLFNDGENSCDLENVIDFVQCDGVLWGLTNGGKLVCKSDDTKYNKIKKLESIVKISGYGNKVILLLRDGTVKTFGSEVRKGDAPTSKWFNIIDVAATPFGFFGVREDGCVFTTVKGLDIKMWKDVVSIAVKEDVVFALTKNGYVYAASIYDDEEDEDGGAYRGNKLSWKITESVEEYVDLVVKKNREKQEQLERFKEKHVEWKAIVAEITNKRKDKEKEEREKIEREYDSLLKELKDRVDKEYVQINLEKEELEKELEKLQNELKNLKAWEFLKKRKIREAIQENNSQILNCDQRIKQTNEDGNSEKYKIIRNKDEKIKQSLARINAELPIPKEPTLGSC